MADRPPNLPPRRNSFCDISSLPYYHPYLTSMEQVKKLLLPYIREEGRFLVRNSTSKPGYYTISVVHSTGIKHFNVERTTTTFYLKDVQFETVDQLVRYYSHTDVPNKELIHGVRLLHAVTRPAPYLSVYDDDPRRSASPDVYIHPEYKRDDRSPKPADSAAVPLPRHRGNTIPSHIRRNQTMNNTTQRPTDLEFMPSSPASALRRSQTVSNVRPTGGESHYTEVDSLDSDRSHALRMREMQLQDQEYGVEGPLCDCGLPVERSSLPRGWSVHLSQDDETIGEVYFMSPSRESSWTLPLDICLELDADQQDFIRDRIYEYEQRTKQTARAKMARASQDQTAVYSTHKTPDASGYIKPSPSPARGPSPVDPSARPQSMFPPGISPVSEKGSSGVRYIAEPEYMCMKGTSRNS